MWLSKQDASPLMPWAVAKHQAGKHDQREHGAWADQREIPAVGGKTQAALEDRQVAEVLEGQTSGSVLQQMLADGGISVTFTGKGPKDGYMVAVPNTEIVVDDATMRSEQGKTIIREHIRKHARMLQEGRGYSGKISWRADQPKNYFGAWHNKQTPQNPDGDNKWYLDISENVDTLTGAVRLGRERSQLAIWDVRGSQGISMDSRFADYAMSREGGNPDGPSWQSMGQRRRRRSDTPSDALKARD